MMLLFEPTTLCRGQGEVAHDKPPLPEDPEYRPSVNVHLSTRLEAYSAAAYPYTGQSMLLIELECQFTLPDNEANMGGHKVGRSGGKHPLQPITLHKRTP